MSVRCHDSHPTQNKVVLAFRLMHMLIVRDGADCQEGFVPASHLRAIDEQTLLRMQVITAWGYYRGRNVN